MNELVEVNSVYVCPTYSLLDNLCWFVSQKQLRIISSKTSTVIDSETPKDSVPAESNDNILYIYIYIGKVWSCSEEASFPIVWFLAQSLHNTLG